MRVDLTKRALKAIKALPAPIRKSFHKQTNYLSRDIQHPSLYAKKVDEAHDIWQARVNRDWRFYLSFRGIHTS